MALLFPSLSLAPSSSSLPALFIPLAANFSPKLQTNLYLYPRSLNGVTVPSPALVQKRLTVARASSGTDGKEGSVPEAAPSEVSEEAVSVENLPLESKLQLKLDQKLRMKLAKKVRLRRKRLLRKRKMRKKGRWPPSKMKKLKNV
ncbi:50S ribosomal protein 5, chloroplastic-like [Canna indica]|uniref:50S ribosomal protein 5, chloroplastic-like n=1 Tax=Canna indica TaxID=4628 RepID=A0AAQ3Q4N2_9LILI|nr:50S ribosomal protein 5, chloroplastic-like [Canna indica]